MRSKCSLMNSLGAFIDRKEELKRTTPLQCLSLESTLRCNLDCLHCGSDCVRNDSTQDQEIDGELIKRELRSLAGARSVLASLEPGTTARRPIEGLERVAGDPRCAGWHLAVLAHAALWSVAVEDLQSPLGVCVEVPEHINDDR